MLELPNEQPETEDRRSPNAEAAGSFNYTAPANEYNDENLFVIGSPHEEVEGIRVEVDPVRDIATHMRAEIERLFNLSEPFLPG